MRALFAAIGFVWFAYCCARAYCLPLTIDEGATWFNHVPRSLRDLLLFTDPVPNNHLLNTLTIKAVTAILPASEWTVRLPVLLGAIAYFVGALGIATLLSRETWVRVLALAALLGNPYVNEMLALARGYGMACGLMLVAIWQAMRFFESGKNSDLLRAMLFGALAVLANFTALNFFLPFVFFLMLVIFQRRQFSRDLARQSGIVLGATAILAALCYTPFKRMSETNQFDFWAKTSFYKETVLTTANCFWRATRPLGEQSVEVLASVFVVFWAFWGIATLWKWRGWRWNLAHHGIFAWAMLSGAAAMTILQAAFIATPYLAGRTALIFWPLLAIGIPVLAEWARPRLPRISMATGMVATLLFAVHVGRTANLRESFEWPFDQNTYEIMRFLENVHHSEARSEKIVLHCRWLYNNSLQFAIKTRYPNIVAEMPWIDKATADSPAEFFYTDRDDDWKSLETNFEKVLELADGNRFLFRRKK